MEKNMKKMLYVLVISLLSFTIYSCAKKSDTSSTTTTTELEGTWQTPCHTSGSYYRIKKVIVTSTNITDTFEYHTDSSCATDYSMWTYTWSSLSIGNELTFSSYGSSGGSGHDFTLTLSDTTYTPQTSGKVSQLNTDSYCGLTDWELNTPLSVAGKTCDSSTQWATGSTIYGIYLLDGSKFFWNLSSDAYNDSVPTGDNDTFTKQ
jgi:hypothetical protein